MDQMEHGDVRVAAAQEPPQDRTAEARGDLLAPPEQPPEDISQATAALEQEPPLQVTEAVPATAVDAPPPQDDEVGDEIDTAAQQAPLHQQPQAAPLAVPPGEPSPGEELPAQPPETDPADSEAPAPEEEIPPASPHDLQSATLIAEVRPIMAEARQLPQSPDPGPVQGEGMAQLLAASVGRVVVGDFWVGDRQLTRREGLLVQVGADYLLLQEEPSGTQLVCPLAHLRFLAIRPPRQQQPQDRPHQAQHRAEAPPQPPRRGPWR